MTPEELKEKWRKLNDTPDGDKGGYRKGDDFRDTIIDNVVSGRATSARDRLMRSYRMMFSVVAPIGIVCTLPVHRILPWWGVALIILFFLVAAMMDLYLYRGIRAIDLSVDGVEEVAAKARFYRRRHHLFQILLIPFAIMIFAIYFCYFTVPEMRWGMVVGGAVGLAVGLSLYLRMMRDYRQML